MAKILVVEDNVPLSNGISDLLRHHGHIVESVYTGQEAVTRLTAYFYDILILDWQLPDKSGIEVCSEFRAIGGQTPILMLTGKSLLADKETGLDAGADDYLTKPFEPRELIARLRALLRRMPSYRDHVLEFGDTIFDTRHQQVTVNGSVLHLVPKESALLEYLMRHSSEVISSEALLNHVWSSESETSVSVIRTYIYNLRKKLEKQGATVSIETVHGRGYKLIWTTSQPEL